MDEGEHEAVEIAFQLIESIRSSLRVGVKHFSKDGDLLTTVDEVLEALERNGEIKLLPTNSDFFIPMRIKKE